MSGKRKSVYFFIGLFIVLICLPWVFWIFLGKFLDATNYENRYKTEKPVFDIEMYGNYPSEYESYFNDNLPFRNEMITLNSWINYFVFHASTNDKVIIGKDDWLFYGNDNEIPVACWWGNTVYTEAELQKIADNLTAIEAYLADRGIEFVVFIAPYKERIYPEMLPDYYGAPPERHMAEQVVDYIEENTDIRIVYPYKELIEVKEQVKDAVLYYKTDTHWNRVGAYVGSVALCRELGVYLPELTGNEVSIERIGDWAGDLTSMIHLGKYLRGNDSNYSITGYNDHDIENRTEDVKVASIYHSTGADTRKVYIAGDSYFTSMAEYVGSQFNDSYIVHRANYTSDSLQEQAPDIFVLEVIDSGVGALGYFSIAEE